MDAAAAFGDRNALHAVDPALELETGKDTGAADRSDRLLVAAKLGSARGDELELPALDVGVALVHAKEIAREERRLVPACPSANLEHRRPVVRGVARQKPDR